MESQDSSGSSNAELTAAGEAQQKTHNGSSGANGGHSSSVDSASSPSHINEDGTPVNFPTNNRNTRDVSEVAEGKLVSVGNVASEGPPPVPVSEIVAGEEGHSVAGADTDNQKSEGGDLSAKRPPVDGPGFDGQVNTGISQEDATEENSPGHSDKTALADQASTDKEISQEGGGSVDGPAKANKADLEGQGFTGSEVSQDQEDATEEDAPVHLAKPKQVVLEEKVSIGTGISQEDTTEGGLGDGPAKPNKGDLEGQGSTGQEISQEDVTKKISSDGPAEPKKTVLEGQASTATRVSQEDETEKDLADCSAKPNKADLEGQASKSTGISQEEVAEYVSVGDPAKSSNDSKVAKDELTLESWLSHLGLSKYHAVFMKNCFEDLESALAIEEEDLDDMGVLRGHKRKLLGRKQSGLILGHKSAEDQDGKLVVKNWLTSAGCERYFERFLKEGFDDFEALSQVKGEDLDFMEVARGHKRKILKRLKQSGAVQSSEPGGVTDSASKANSGSKTKLFAQNSYKGKTDEELSFEKGQTVILLEEYTDGRCRGSVNGKEGVFPKAAVFAESGNEAKPKTQDSGPKERQQKSGPENNELAKRDLSKAEPSAVPPESDTSASKVTAHSSSDEVVLPKIAGQISAPTEGNDDSKKSTQTVESSTGADFHLKALKEIAGSAGSETTGSFSNVEQPSTAAEDQAGGNTNRTSARNSNLLGKGSSSTEEQKHVNATPLELCRPPLDAFIVNQFQPDTQGNKVKGGSGAESQQDNTKKVVLPPHDAAREEAKSRGGSNSAEPQGKPASTKHGDEPGVSGEEESSSDDSNEFEDALESQDHIPSALAHDSTKRGLDDGVLVTFHALLHPEWNLKEHQKVWIRFGIPKLGNFEENIVTMGVTRTFTVNKDEMRRLSGSFTLDPNLSRRPIQYKYVVVGKRRKRKGEFEYLCDAQVHGGAVNRVLLLPEDLRGSKEGEFVKYDSVIRKEPGKLDKFAVKVKETFLYGSNRFLRDREVAVKEMLPKWTGFYCQEEPNVRLFHMRACNALAQFRDVIKQLEFLSIIEDKDRSGWPHGWSVGLNVQKLVSSVLKPKINQLGEMEPSDDEMAVERIVSAVAIAIAIKEYKLDMKTDQLGFVDYQALASAFALCCDERVHLSLTALLENFSDLKFVLGAVLGICSQLVSKQQPAAEWIMAVPLVHFLSHLSEPFKVRQFDWRKDDWWGLGKLERDARQYQKKAGCSNFRRMQERLLPLIALDPLLLRVILFVSSIDDVKMWTGAASSASECIVALVKKIDAMGFGSGSDNLPLVTVLRGTLPSLSAMVLETEIDSHLGEVFASVKTGIESSVYLLKLLRLRFISRKEADVLHGTISLLFKHFDVLDRIKASGFDGQLTEGAVTRSKSTKSAWDVEMIENAADVVAEWIHVTTTWSCPTVATISSDIKLWSAVFDTDNLNAEMTKRWRDLLLNQLNEKLKKFRPRSSPILEALSNMRTEQIHREIELCYYSVSEPALKKSLKSNDDDLGSTFSIVLATARGNCRVAAGRSVDLLKSILCDNSPAVDEHKGWLESLVSWPLWRQYLTHANELFPDRNRNSEVFRILSKVERVVEDLVDKLAANDVTVEQLELCTKDKAKILGICSILDASKRFEVSLRATADSSFARLSEELHFFREEQTLISNFVLVCQNLGKSKEGKLIFVLYFHFKSPLMTLWRTLLRAFHVDLSEVWLREKMMARSTSPISLFLLKSSNL
eukprot:m.206023 g.206023  ORF g.206023 m.206023 type:complete len:1729 (+) comp39667_c0_seq12:93-5279(+)